MQPFVVNSHGRIVFPSNFVPELDLSVIDSLEQLDSVIRRDFETKAPTGTDILQRVEAGALRQPLRADARRRAEPVLGQPLRHDDVREAAHALGATCRARRNDVFLPILTPWEDGDRKVAAVQSAYDDAAGDLGRRRRRTGSSAILFDVFGHRKHHATELPAVKPTVAEILADPENLTFRLHGYDPDYPVVRATATSSTAPRTSPSSRRCTAGRWCCTTSTPGTASQAELVEVGELSRRRLRRGLPPPRPGGARSSCAGSDERRHPARRLGGPGGASSRCGPTRRSTCASSSR